MSYYKQMQALDHDVARLERLDALVENMTEEQIDQWVRDEVKTYSLSVKFYEARARVRFRVGLFTGAMPFTLRHAMAISIEQIRQCKQDGTLYKLVSQTFHELMDLHEPQCRTGALCSMHNTVDATIFAAFIDDWAIAMYAEADQRDFEQMKKEVVRWQNWRSINQ